jgi:glycosyltransferase involved in cell wall biosynthesis
MATISVCVAVYNEGMKAERLLALILAQTRLPDEVIIVDDGSTDDTFARLNRMKTAYSGTCAVKIETQKNRGPAAARNLAWKLSTSEISVFTDGDCTPDGHWIEKLVAPFDRDPTLLAAGGAYADPKSGNLLSRFIGFEISWRYSRMSDQIDCHGSYNLAVRRVVMEKLGGFNEKYPKPSGEDFDLTYRISEMKPLAFVRDAQVGHDHPDQFWWYMKNQYRRGFDRVTLYLDHMSKAKSDSYTDPWVKFEVLTSAAALYSLPLLVFLPGFAWFTLALSTFLIISSVRPFPFLVSRGGLVLAAYGSAVRFARIFAWMLGLHAGFLNAFQTYRRASIRSTT